MTAVAGSSPLYAAASVVETVASLAPRSVLDLGCGTGKFGFLLRERFDLSQGRVHRDEWALRIDGVEGFTPYISEMHRLIYNEVFAQDIRTFVSSPGRHYDLVLLLDVIEHFSAESAQSIVSEVMNFTNSLLITTPPGYYSQVGHRNDLETHLSWWPATDLRQLATSCRATAAIHRSRWATMALFSKTDGTLKHESLLLEVASSVRSLLTPEVAWCRLRGKAGPRPSLR
jgi:hypothetical protein